MLYLSSATWGVLYSFSFQGLTERERLALHAEVKALQEQQGLSYKDAAHRLYHAEVRALDEADTAHTALAELHHATDKYIVDDIYNAIKDIDHTAPQDIDKY